LFPNERSVNRSIIINLKENQVIIHETDANANTTVIEKPIIAYIGSL